MNSFEKYEDFFPKVYRCPCVLPAVKHCFENDKHSLGEILESVKSFMVSCFSLQRLYVLKLEMKKKTV